MLSPRVQLTQKYTPIMRGNGLAVFSSRTRPCKLRRRHDEQKLVSRLWQQNEFFRTFAPPAGWNSNAILFVDGMAKLAGVETFGLGISVHSSSGAVFHFTPLDTTFIHFSPRESTKFFTPLRQPVSSVSSSKR